LLRHLAPREAHKDTLVQYLHICEIGVVIKHRLLGVFVLYEDFGPIEVYAALTELSVALLYMRLRGKKHKDTTLNAFVYPVDKSAEVAEALANVLVFEVKFEWIAVVVGTDDRRKHLLRLNVLLVCELDLEMRLEFRVQDPHWGKGT